MAAKSIGLVLGVALLVAGCGAAKESSGIDTSGAAESLPGLTPEKLEKIRAWSIQTAHEMGEDHPTDGIILATTQHHFYDLTQGPTMGTPDFDAFVVAYKGDFTAYGASTPSADVPAPRGHSVYAIYHADTLEVSDWGIGGFTFDPAEIGPWMPLDLDD